MTDADVSWRKRLADERALASTRYPLDGLVDALQTSGAARITSAQGAWLALVLADLAERLDGPLAVVAPLPDDARGLHAALQTFDRGTAVLLPAPDVSPYAGTAPDRNVVMRQLDVARTASTLGPGDVLVASAAAWARRAVPEPEIDRMTMSVALDEDVDVDRLREVLVAGGYTPVSLCEDPGTFSIRGDLVDIYPPGDAPPVRVELYGDMVETIRVYDPTTQRSGAEVESFVVSPVREEILDEATLQHARHALADLGAELRVPSSRMGAVFRDMQQGVRFFGIESYRPALYDRLVPIVERLPDTTTIVVVDAEKVAGAWASWLDARRVEYEREVAGGELVFAPERFFVDEDELAASLEGAKQRVDVGRFGGDESAPAFDVPALANDDVVRARKQRAGEEGGLHAVLEPIERWRELYGRVVFVAHSRGSADRIANLLRGYGADAVRLDAGADLTEQRPAPCTQYEIAVGDLTSGFRSPARGLAVLTDTEVLGRAVRRVGREVAREATAVSSFKELQPGDLLVHIDFGIGRYAGLERISAGHDVENDFLAIDYADGDRLYLPVYRLGRVSKYVGSATFTRLDKLGGTSWERTRERVKKQLADLAEELIQMYAERASRTGFAYSPPDDLYREFEAAFPYEETTGQLDAIHDVLHDMLSDKPMDRLLCGDVGFGKTEVAIRAAFKAVVDGKQVAVLVPTTVLAEQHLKSFRERLADTPARVEGVSRFRSSADIKKTIADTAEGKVDILIGTHRLLSKDVEFADLGLLIVDEEQRFGVTHKEKLKRLRSTVDVLTMTATPIPRTLEMSLLGIRDLSVILTPPAGRLAVRTHLAKFGEGVIREAVMAELKRGGQVFFVHNRVETIENMADQLQRMVPEAKIAVGHAQMADGALEKVMMRFLDRKADVLISTTIIESGIDVASANTILINDAHRFGLAQLHQLRGRVGRSSQRAYCYLLVGDPRRLKPDAERRLEVLQQHTDLGAGLQIAHQDLDMRGAGNVLGRDQSGHIEAVGFELYSELLQEAIADLKGETAEPELEPEVKVPIGAYIPDDYVRDVSQRLAFYKKYSMATTDADLFDVHGEIEDRYGRAPEQVEALRDICLLKISMRQLRAETIEAGPKSVVVTLRSDTKLDPQKVIALIEANRGKYEFRPPMTLLRHLKGAESKDILASAMRVAREVGTCVAS